MLQVCNDVVYVLHTYGEPYCGLVDVLCLELLRTKLGVGCRGRMNHQTLDIGDIGQQGKQF